MNSKKYYLVAAIVGAVVPYAFFIGFFVDEGLGLPAFISGLFANGAAGGFTADLLITSAVFWQFMFRRRGGPNPWPFIAINLVVGLACAFPLYLYRSAGTATAAEA